MATTDAQPLKRAAFCVSPALAAPANMQRLRKHGAIVLPKISRKNTTHVLAAPHELSPPTPLVAQAMRQMKPLVGLSFVDACIAAGRVVEWAPHQLRPGAEPASSHPPRPRSRGSRYRPPEVPGDRPGRSAC